MKKLLMLLATVMLAVPKLKATLPDVVEIGLR